MGKTSYKVRHGAPPRKPKCHPTKLVHDDDRVGLREEEFDTVDHTEKNVGYTSFDEALAACISDGWEHAAYCPDFTSTALVTTLNQLVAADVTVVDKTAAIPRGCEGNYTVLPLTTYQLTNLSKKDPSTAFLIMRNRSNTPAFLCGLMAGYVAVNGGDEGAAYAAVRNTDTPAGFLLHAGEKIDIPTLAVQGTETLVAEMLAACIDNDPQKFCCTHCNDSIMKKHGSAWGTTGFVAFECNHRFHPWCIHKHYLEVALSCPVCHPDPALEQPVEA